MNHSGSPRSKLIEIIFQFQVIDNTDLIEPVRSFGYMDTTGGVRVQPRASNKELAGKAAKICCFCCTMIFLLIVIIVIVMYKTSEEA